MSRNTHAVTAGIFVLVLMTALIIAIYWIGNLDSERNNFVISTRGSVSGLNPESTVFYRGIAVGKVLKVYFDPDDPLTILIPIEIDRDVQFSRGVYASLRLKGVTGLTQIDLQDSGEHTEWLPAGFDPDNRIPLLPSLTDRLMDSGLDILVKVELLMKRLDRILSEENEAQGKLMLSNLNEATVKLINIEDHLTEALKEVPSLAINAKNTLKGADMLIGDLRNITADLKAMGANANNLAESGQRTGQMLITETLPKLNEMFIEFKTTLQQVRRVAGVIEENPQALLLGGDEPLPGPGEPGYKEPVK